MSMKSERTFGVEIEAHGLTVAKAFSFLKTEKVIIKNGRSPSPSKKHPWKRNLIWSVSYDGGGFELRTPVLTGTQGLTKLHEVLTKIVAAGAIPNEQCGLHVHAGISTYSVSDMKSLLLRYKTFEPAIDNFVDMSRRKNLNMFCGSLSAISNSDIQKATSLKKLIAGFPGRNYKVNPTAYLKYGTVENRHAGNVIDPDYIVNWTQFWIEFVDASVLPRVLGAPVPTPRFRLGKNKNDRMPTDLGAAVQVMPPVSLIPGDTWDRGISPNVVSYFRNRIPAPRIIKIP